MICFGVANAIAAGIAGALVERIGRVTLAAICAVLNLCLLAYMYNWEAREGDYLMYCTFAAIWGICDGVWLVVVNGKRKALSSAVAQYLLAILQLFMAFCFPTI